MFKWFLYPRAVVFAQSIEARCKVENEDVVGAAPTGDAPTTSELSTNLLPTKVRLILDVFRYSSQNKDIQRFKTSKTSKTVWSDNKDIEEKLLNTQRKYNYGWHKNILAKY